jgi:hypothetical protein
LIHAILFGYVFSQISEFKISGQAGYIAQIPELLGSNHQQWRKLLRMALLMLGLEWVLDKKCPTKPEKVVRGAEETDEAWKALETAYVAAESDYQLQIKEVGSRQQKMSSDYADQND